MRKAIIWGMGDFARRVLAKRDILCDFILTGITSNEESDGSIEFFGLPFIPKRELASFRDDYLIIISSRYSDVVNQVYRDKLFSLDRIYIFGDIDLLDRGKSMGLNDVPDRGAVIGRPSQSTVSYVPNSMFSPITKLRYLDLTRRPEAELVVAETLSSNPGDLHLFFPYYHSSSIDRQSELDYCLKENIKLGIFSTIYILSESKVSVDIPKSSTKVRVIEYGRRINYSDWIDLTKSENVTGITILSNADIVFNTSINYAKQLLVSSPNLHNFLAISRHETGDTLAVLHNCPHYSQDVWAFHTDSLAKINNLRRYQIPLGTKRCDSKVAYLLKEDGFSVLNPCGFIQVLHYHSSKVRTYSNEMNYDNLGLGLFVYPVQDTNELSFYEIAYFEAQPSRTMNSRLLLV